MGCLLVCKCRTGPVGCGNSSLTKTRYKVVQWCESLLVLEAPWAAAEAAWSVAGQSEAVSGCPLSGARADLGLSRDPSAGVRLQRVELHLQEKAAYSDPFQSAKHS